MEARMKVVSQEERNRAIASKSKRLSQEIDSFALTERRAALERENDDVR